IAVAPTMPRGLRLWLFIKHMVEVIFRLCKIRLACRHATAHRNAGFMHRLAAPGNEVMPPVEVSAFRNQPIGASLRQPRYGADFRGSEPHAIRHDRKAVGIIVAPARTGVEEPARHRGPVYVARILILELRQAAFAATVAKS